MAHPTELHLSPLSPDAAQQRVHDTAPLQPLTEKGQRKGWAGHSGGVEGKGQPPVPGRVLGSVRSAQGLASRALMYGLRDAS